ncbi:hypothetical protein ASPACDRAFT_37492 [Aspergillus aculeatus ATCC 16872]|uniref:CENP-V/GFA domain-containing protein n=1 Tax=Aspergillus aculeatus (strain ATCC 16872 / CBS 172.66 / WB 5094) TaxID=690307 RepID=A0A1L9WER0_ASPA1|nr:uncharacterized protein ASPACDRAFT_37492 [Aspergillus aculeatus ATCC 16872]OJJ94666.1 hypothetical protein ASPACDRAFT_37492 [Aspergillus aculeatus ATCC 16872]
MDASTTDEAKSHFPIVGSDGWSTADEATATCFCGAVQLSFPTHGPGFVVSFICNCTDCHKITASIHSTGFIVHDTYLKHLRGQAVLKTYTQPKSPGSETTVTNHFCSTCGSLMYRVSAAYPGMSALRVGTVDDFSLHETRLRPTVELFTKDRVAWKPPTAGVEQFVADGLH